MIQEILEFLQGIALRHSDAAVMAWVQFIPAVLSGVSAIYGGIKNARARNKQKREISKWNAENKSIFNNDYYKDYTQTQEAQNVIRQARNIFDQGAKRDANTAVVMGSTVEGQAAAKEARNRTMANLFANLGAQGTRYKERAKDRYLHGNSQIRAMQYGQLGQDADNASNLMYNGIQGIANSDWAGIMGGNKGGKKNYNPSNGLGSTIPDYSEFKKNNPF